MAANFNLSFGIKSFARSMSDICDNQADTVTIK